MRFSTVFAVLTGSAMAFAGAVPQIAAKRSIADVQAACNFFLDGIAPEFSSCGSNDTCVTTVVDQLVIAINNCTTALHTIPDGALPANETLADGIGNATAVSLGGLQGLTHFTHTLSQIIVEGFNELETGCNGQCSSLIALTQDLDFAISGLLTEVFKVVTGLKALVVSL